MGRGPSPRSTGERGAGTNVGARGRATIDSVHGAPGLVFLLLLVGCGRLGYDAVEGGGFGEVVDAAPESSPAGEDGAVADSSASPDGAGGDGAVADSSASPDGAGDGDGDGDGVVDHLDAVPWHPGCSQTLLFFDDFVTDPADRWMTVAGTWAWDASGMLRSTDGSHTHASTWVGPATWERYLLEVRMRVESDARGDAGMQFRIVRPNETEHGGDLYSIGIWPSQDRLVLGYTDGAWNLLHSAGRTIEPNTWDVLRVRVGADLVIEVDDTVIATEPNSRIDPGSVGLHTYRMPASYDYVLVCD